jgi:hypothetical protein
MMMSLSGQEIYMLVRGEDIVLKKFAEKYLMELSVGSSDLISLQPCDWRLIPFRYIKHDRENIHRLEEQLSDYFTIVENQLKDISTAKVKKDNNLSDNSLKESTWRTYEIYLEELLKILPEFRMMIKNYPKN